MVASRQQYLPVICRCYSISQQCRYSRLAAFAGGGNTEVLPSLTSTELDGIRRHCKTKTSEHWPRSMVAPLEQNQPVICRYHSISQCNRASTTLEAGAAMTPTFCVCTHAHVAHNYILQLMVYFAISRMLLLWFFHLRRRWQHRSTGLCAQWQDQNASRSD